MKTYICHTDGGHGWLAVKREELFKLGILHKITRCSYQRGKTVYLEEDCDAGTFLTAMEKAGTPVPPENFKDSYYDRSPVRSYYGFSICDEDLKRLTQEQRQEYVNDLQEEDKKYPCDFLKYKLAYLKEHWDLTPDETLTECSS